MWCLYNTLYFVRGITPKIAGAFFGYFASRLSKAKDASESMYYGMAVFASVSIAFGIGMLITSAINRYFGYFEGIEHQSRQGETRAEQRDAAIKLQKFEDEENCCSSLCNSFAEPFKPKCISRNNGTGRQLTV